MSPDEGPAQPATRDDGPAEVPVGSVAWQRVHPLTPLASLRILPMIVSAYLINRFWRWGQTRLGFRDEDPDRGAPDPLAFAVSLVRDGGRPLALAVTGALTVMALSVALSWLSWRRSLFRLSDETFEHRSGVLFRRHRQVKAERIQAVEIHRRLLPRLLGLAAVDIQSAGSFGSNVVLKYLPHARAVDLRDTLLARTADADDEVDASDAAGERPGDAAAGSVADCIDERNAATLVVIPNARALQAVLYRPTTPVAALVLAAGAVVLAAKALLLLPGLASQPTLGRVSDLALPLAVPLALAFGVVAEMWSTFRRTAGTVVQRTSAGVRVGSGLLGSHSTSIPRQRVQSLELSQGVLHRRFGWWRVVVHTAASGAASGDGKPGVTLALPVGTFDEAQAVIRQLDPRLDPEVLRVAAQGEGGEPGWYGVAPAGRLFEPVQFRRHAMAVTAHAAYVRSGRFGRSVMVLPQARIQVVTLDQGPFARRRGLAAILLHAPKGPGDATMRNLSVAQAEDLYAREAELTAAARASARAARAA